MKIEYNIKSYGTETQANVKGYMAVTEIVKGKRYILPISPDIKESDLVKGFLTINKPLSLEKIVLSRFGLISQLFLDRITIKKDAKILVIGVGCVGFACIYILYCNHFSNIFYTDIIQRDISYATEVLTDNLKYDDYDYIIDATGNKNVIENIIARCKPLSAIVLLGTCRQNANIDPDSIHRKNLLIYGAHELSGLSDEYRQKVFDRVVNKIYKCNYTFNNVVSIKQHSEIDIDSRDSIFTIYKNNL